jgi:hypothetical protein
MLHDQLHTVNFRATKILKQWVVIVLVVVAGVDTVEYHRAVIL